MPGISINTTAKIITPAKFQKRCESLLKQKFVRFTEEEKQEIVKISQNTDVSPGFEKLSSFLKDKFEKIKLRESKVYTVGKSLINLERVADNCNKIAKYEEKVFKFFENLVYRSSSNSDVLSIEQNFRKKGVKAKFSDRSSLDFVKLTQEAFEDIEKKSYELPKRIAVSELMDKSTAGLVNMAPTTIPATTVFISKFHLACKTLNQISNTQLLNNMNNHSSTANPKHTLYHEIGHWLHSKIDLKQLFMPYFSACSNIPGIKPTLSENNAALLKTAVSKYSASTPEMGLEAVAEIFAGLMDGKTYPPEVMEIYHRLKGPMPKAK